MCLCYFLPICKNPALQKQLLEDRHEKQNPYHQFPLKLQKCQQNILDKLVLLNFNFSIAQLKLLLDNKVVKQLHRCC